MAIVQHVYSIRKTQGFRHVRRERLTVPEDVDELPEVIEANLL